MRNFAFTHNLKGGGSPFTHFDSEVPLCEAELVLRVSWSFPFTHLNSLQVTVPANFPGPSGLLVRNFKLTFTDSRGVRVPGSESLGQHGSKCAVRRARPPPRVVGGLEVRRGCRRERGVAKEGRFGRTTGARNRAIIAGGGRNLSLRCASERVAAGLRG